MAIKVYRVLKFKIAISIFVLLLPVAGFLYSREGPLSRQEIAELEESNLFRALSIERLDMPLPAPDFTLTDLEEKPVSLHGFRGKVIFLNFWATWCPPCRLEMPTMEKLHRQLGPQGLVILAVNFQEGSKQIRDFFKTHELSFPVLQDEGAEAFELYQAWSLPTTFLIDREGKIVGKVVGYRDWDAKLALSFFRQLLDAQL